MGLTVNRRMAKKNSLLGVKIDEFQLLVLKETNRRYFSFDLNKKKLTVSPKMAKILIVSLKSYHPI